MRVLVIAATLLAVVAAPAAAQMGRRHGNEGPKAEKKAPQIDEKAYKAALDRIPEPKDKYDPWSGARPTEPARKPK